MRMRLLMRCYAMLCEALRSLIVFMLLWGYGDVNWLGEDLCHRDGRVEGIDGHLLPFSLLTFAEGLPLGIVLCCTIHIALNSSRLELNVARVAEVLVVGLGLG